MELWEGAILTLGGIYLIGRLSRQSPNHPANVAAAANASLQAAGATPIATPAPPSTPSLETGDQSQSTGGLVAGEPLATPLPTVGNTPIAPAVPAAPVQVSGTTSKPPWLKPSAPASNSKLRRGGIIEF